MMKWNEVASKMKTRRKAHLVFAGLYLAAFLLSVGWNMRGGAGVTNALIEAARSITLVDFIWAAFFWFVYVTYEEPKDEWPTASFVTLNLRETKK